MQCSAKVPTVYLIFGVILLLHTVRGGDGNHEDIDPFDMENFDQISMKMKKKSNPAAETSAERSRDHPSGLKTEFDRVEVDEGNQQMFEATDENSGKITSQERADKAVYVCPKERSLCRAHFLFQQLVSRLLLFVKGKIQQGDEHTVTDICLRLSLSPHDLEVFENFKREGTENNIDRTHEILTHAVHGAHTVGADDPSLHILWLEEKFGVSVEKAVQILIMAVLCVIFLVIFSKLQLSLRLFTWLFFLMFIISVMSTWFRLYKVWTEFNTQCSSEGEVAKQHEAMMKDLPKGCQRLPEGSSTWENIANVYRHYFTFQKDACVEYYEHLVVDPIVKVSIMEALAVAVVQTLLKPMRTVGTEISEFMRALVKDLPVQWQLSVVIIFFALVFLAMFLSCGYRVRVPFLLAIEPTHADKSNDVRSLQRQVAALQARIESIGPTGTTQSVKAVPSSSTHRLETQSEWPKRITAECTAAQDNSRLQYRPPETLGDAARNPAPPTPVDTQPLEQHIKGTNALQEYERNGDLPQRTPQETVAMIKAGEMDVEMVGDGARSNWDGSAVVVKKPSAMKPAGDEMVDQFCEEENNSSAKNHVGGGDGDTL